MIFGPGPRLSDQGIPVFDVASHIRPLSSAVKHSLDEQVQHIGVCPPPFSAIGRPSRVDVVSVIGFRIWRL